MARRVDHVRSAILNVLLDHGKPLGAARLATLLKGVGIDLRPRSVRFHLLRLDAEGLTRRVSRRAGREVTAAGRDEAARANVLRKLGFVAARVDVLTYRMSFSLRASSGTVVANVATVRRRDLPRAMPQIEPVFRAGLTMGSKLAVVDGGESFGGLTSSATEALLGTVCSVTVNGLLMKEGIPVTSRFGGLLEMRGGEPVRFVELIEYRGTTIDPLEIFILAGKTSVLECAATGNGTVGAGFREFPSDALQAVRQAQRAMARRGLGGIVAVGEPSRPLLEIPVSEGRTGMIVMGGMNPYAALHESGIPLSIHSLAGLEDLARFEDAGATVRRWRRRYPYVD
jgi:repressor of nif and glnA expression